MNLFPRLVGVVLATLVLTAAAASAQEYRWVRGTVTTIRDEMLTVYVAGLDLNLPFAVDRSSVVIAQGAGSVVRPPEQTQPKLSDFFKPGGAIEVHYYARKAAANYAGIIIPRPGGGQESGRSVAGRVTAVSRETLTVEVDDRPHTFAVERATRVIGPGQGRREEPTLTDLIGKNDTVLVLYRGEGTTLVATEIYRVRAGAATSSSFGKD